MRPGLRVRARKWPVLLLFDPRGRGGVPLELFRDAADEFGWIATARLERHARSDGGLREQLRAVNGLVADVVKRLTGRRAGRIHAGGFPAEAVLAWDDGVADGRTG